LLLALALLGATAAALAFRLPQLALRPMHCDEANQALKAAMLLETGHYRYDPQEHHGPLLYYATLPSLWLAGVKDFAQSRQVDYRIVPVLFGVGLILLLPLVADGLGRMPTVLAGLLTAVSPALVFYSRYYIQETLLVFLTFAAIASAWRYVRGGSLLWAAATGLFLGLMCATKETWILAAAAMGVGLALTLAWGRWRDGAWPELRPHSRPARVLVATAAGLLAFLLVFCLLYSSLGTNLHGPIDAVLAYGTYFRRGSEGGNHSHPWYYYLEILVASRPLRGYVGTETLIVALALAGSVAALASAGVRIWSPRVPLLACPAVPAATLLDKPAVAPGGDTETRGQSEVISASPPLPLSPSPLLSLSPSHFCRFLAFYTLTLTALYSALAYKTPWCLLSFLHGMVLLAGLGGWALIRRTPWLPAKVILGLALALAAGHLARESYLLNYRFYAYPERNPYVYAQASSDVVHLADLLQRLARASGQGCEMSIHAVAEENYWPLPWYLRAFHRAGCWKGARAWLQATGLDHPARTPTEQARRDRVLPAVLILTDDVRPAVDAVLGSHYRQKMTYGLQPGVLLTVYVRDDVWQAFLRSQ
jgi:uncharacterized protein (TIGR03663 family)